MLESVILSILVKGSGFETIQSSRPNIVLFLVDDLGQRDIGAYGSTFHETPNLDKFAKEGVKFTDAYSNCPVCSPTRASLLTGKYPQRTGVTDYLGVSTKWTANTKLIPAPLGDRLELKEETVAELLKANGYETFFAGKWHLGPEGYFPENQGFDINKGGHERGGPYGGKMYFSPYGNPRLTDGPDGEHLADRLANETCSFIRSTKQKPFFAMYSFYDVHSPHMAHEDLVVKYRNKKKAQGIKDIFEQDGTRETRMNQGNAVYAGMVDAMDQAVGKVLRELDRQGLSENTLVIFTSDNGGLSTSEGWVTANAPFRGGKGWMYEGGIRVPLLVRWPRAFKSGLQTSYPAMSMDIFSTILSAAKAKKPSVDGVDLSDILKGKRGKHRSIYWDYPHYGNQGGAPGAVIRDGNYKLIEWYEDNKVELFDLSKDVSERNNLALADSNRAKSMLEKLRNWRKSVGAKSTSVNSNYDASQPDWRVAKRQQ
jgi:arylsulfatase A-like enzyme